MAQSMPIVPGAGALDAPPVAKNAATSGLVDTSSNGLNTAVMPNGRPSLERAEGSDLRKLGGPLDGGTFNGISTVDILL
jgi:hypothetical protein